MAQKNKPDFDLFIQDIEQKMKTCNQRGQKNLRQALEILLKDATKWKYEYENGLIDFTDASVEISCLHIFAQQEIRQGDANCNPEAVKSFLTI